MSKSRSHAARNAATLAELVLDFENRLGPRGPLEHGYLDWIVSSRSFREAAMRACRSTLPNGKRHNHQSRVPMAKLETFAEELIRKKSVIRRARSFDDFFVIVDSCKFSGIGPVTVYDVAVRLGEYLNLQPKRVHLHAGVRDGAEALGIRTRGKIWLSKKELPRELRRLTADECEDFLCVYRSLFPHIRKEG